MPSFRDDPTTPGRRIWRRSRAPFVGNAIVLAFFFALMASGVVALGYVATHGRDHGLRLFTGAVIGLLLLFFAALARLLWRDALGKTRSRIALDAHGLELDLPRLRSLMHNPPACRERVPYAAIRSVETRLEAYPTFGMANLQRAYWLERTDAPPIFLFEERALGSALAEASMAPIATEIARRAGVPIHDRGMTRGRAGILGAWFAHAPPYSAEPLSEDAAARMIRRAALTSTLIGAVFVLMLLGSLL